MMRQGDFGFSWDGGDLGREVEEKEREDEYAGKRRKYGGRRGVIS